MTFNVRRISCCPKTISRRPCWCSNHSCERNLFLMFNSFFYPNNLHSLISTYVSEDAPYFKIIRLHICYSFQVLLQFFCLLTSLSQALNYSDWAHYLLIYVNTFLCHLVPSRRPYWQDNDLHPSLCPLHQTKWIQAATGLGRPEVSMEWRRVTSRYHGSKNFWISTKRRAFALAKDGRIVWNTFFFLSAVKHRKVIHFKASVFPPYLQLRGLLRSRNFATMATWRNDVSSLLLELMQKRFWATHVNRKSIRYYFKLPWRYQICISKCLYYYRDDLFINWGKPPSKNAKKKTTNGWHASLHFSWTKYSGNIMSSRIVSPQLL